MRTIIRKNIEHFALPDFRNVGTILRALIAVNALVAIAALVKASTWDAWTSELMDMVATVEPHLLFVLLWLYLAGPWFARLSYRGGIFAVAALTVAVGVAIDALFERLFPLQPAVLLRQQMFGLLIAFALLFYFNLRAKALAPAFTEARLQALQARIRPHFLFNSLNAVLSLIRDEPKQAETALEDMAELFRVLMRDNRGLAPLEDEINLCRQYLALEKVRLGDRLQIDWQLAGMPSDALVPPLALQPLLENAIYHGIEPSSAPGTVTIRIYRKDNDVHAILSNPFRPDGGLHRAGNKLALANLRERLALHFDAEASLQARVTDNVYEAHIRIPYRKAKPGMPANTHGPDTAEIFGPMGSALAAPGAGHSQRASGRTRTPKEPHG